MAVFPVSHYITSAHSLDQLPPDGGREVAFAGRSNVGKSSAINTLLGRRALARVSRTPGRTRQINFFALGENRHVVDLPGYGYAKVSNALRRHWGHTLEAYLATRHSLVAVWIVTDVRRPLGELDRQLLRWCVAAGLAVHVLLTKADKLGRGRGVAALGKARQQLARLHPQATVQLFSAHDRTGADTAQAALAKTLALRPELSRDRPVTRHKGDVD